MAWNKSISLLRPRFGNSIPVLYVGDWPWGHRRPEPERQGVDNTTPKVIRNTLIATSRIRKNDSDIDPHVDDARELEPCWDDDTNALGVKALKIDRMTRYNHHQQKRPSNAKDALAAKDLEDAGKLSLTWMA